MYPIKEEHIAKKGYRFGVKTTYNSFHLGHDDWAPIGTPLYMPFDGRIVKEVNGPSGGLTTWIIPDHLPKVTIRFLHQNKFLVGLGWYKEGTKVGEVGQSGKGNPVPHLHLDIYDGLNPDPRNYKKFINPATFKWNLEVMKKILVCNSKDPKTLYEFDGFAYAKPIGNAYEALVKQFGGVEVVKVPPEEFKKFAVTSELKVVKASLPDPA